MEQVNAEERNLTNDCICTSVRRSSLRSSYSQPLLSYVSPCAIADTGKQYLHTGTAMRKWPHGGAELQSGTLFTECVGTHVACAGYAANYLKILTIGSLYRDPMPLSPYCTKLHYYKWSVVGFPRPNHISG